MPADALDTLSRFDAIFLGCIGDANKIPDHISLEMLLGIRKGFDQYVNLRPIRLYPGVATPLRTATPETVDFAVVRENTEGEYSRLGGIFKGGSPDGFAMQTGRLHPQGHVAGDALRLRAGPLPAQAGGRRGRQGGPGHQLLQVQRPQLLDGLLGPGVRRGGRRLPGCGDQQGLRRRHHHVVRQEPGVVRRDRGLQPVRRHHHRPGLHAAGRHGLRRRRQHRPGAPLPVDVRAHPRLGPQVHRAEAGQPHRLHRGDAHARRAHRRAGRPATPSATPSRPCWSTGEVKTRDMGGTNTTDEVGQAIAALVAAGSKK